MTTRLHLTARRSGILALLAAASLALAACGAGGEAHRRSDDGKVLPTARELDPAGTHYSDTMDAANSGNCSPEILSILTCYSYRGHGYEGAQTALGQCLIKDKKTSEGMQWLKRAADAGWPDAQKTLALIYLDGSTGTTDPVQAGKWANLYRKNPSLLSLGVQPDKKVSEKVQASLNQQQSLEARAMASEWVPQYWKPKTALDAQTAATCYTAPRRAIEQGTLITGPDDPNN